ncbi:uncharacterized protein LOC110808782 [Carica papaya]|uniref:uncharacterized protein LOC110808782 n=1 Tax=Carica papaya TaxID=3649 RepID=UPI000B8CC3B8|nr:uncharacterized protein LOC110808782 [Carica papaya]
MLVPRRNSGPIVGRISLCSKLACFCCVFHVRWVTILVNTGEHKGKGNKDRSQIASVTRARHQHGAAVGHTRFCRVNTRNGMISGQSEVSESISGIKLFSNCCASRVKGSAMLFQKANKAVRVCKHAVSDTMRANVGRDKHRGAYCTSAHTP